MKTVIKVALLITALTLVSGAAAGATVGVAASSPASGTSLSGNLLSDASVEQPGTWSAYFDPSLPVNPTATTARMCGDGHAVDGVCEWASQWNGTGVLQAVGGATGAVSNLPSNPQGVEYFFYGWDAQGFTEVNTHLTLDIKFYGGGHLLYDRTRTYGGGNPGWVYYDVEGVVPSGAVTATEQFSLSSAASTSQRVDVDGGGLLVNCYTCPSGITPPNPANH